MSPEPPRSVQLSADYGRWPTCRKCGGILLAAWPDNHLAHRLAKKRAEQYDGTSGEA